MAEKSLLHIWDAELSDREVFLVGKIVIQWGALQEEIFKQTLLTFEGDDTEPLALPRAMNNLQLSELLDLWKERVIDQAQEDRATVLRSQFDEIQELKDFRDALVHGMWEWPTDDPSKISTVRVRRKQVITTHFTADILEDFYRRMGSINFNIRFPGGTDDYALMLAGRGSYMSRRWVSMITGSPVAGDLMAGVTPPSNEEGQHED